jgi:hypothetical protein
MSEALDFSRYAPARSRPQLAWDNDKPQEHDDLALAIAALRNCVRIIPLAVCVIAAITTNRARDRFDRLMQSLVVSWAAAGSGWGVAIGLAATLILTR